MLLAVAALAVTQSEEGLGGTEVMVSGSPLSSEDAGETSSSLLPVGKKAHYGAKFNSVM